jgi:hypothetical protein
VTNLLASLLGKQVKRREILLTKVTVIIVEASNLSPDYPPVLVYVPGPNPAMTRTQGTWEVAVGMLSRGDISTTG